MTCRPKFVFAVFLAGCSFLPASGQCGFRSKPIGSFSWYRPEGWPTPGVSDAKLVGPLNLTNQGKPLVIDGRENDWPEGLTVARVWHDRDYHLTFSAATFEEGGKPRQMLSEGFESVELLRWEIYSKPFAYSYLLLPDDIGCSSSIDLIDSSGDGEFRLMVAPGHTIMNHDPLSPIPQLIPPPLPAWATRPKS